MNKLFAISSKAKTQGEEEAALPPAPLRDAFAPALWQRLTHLDQTFGRVPAPLPGAPLVADHAPPEAHAQARTHAYDVALVGGGLSLVLAPLLAARGLRVVVIERARAGAAHREWNASAQELQALVESGLCAQAELDTLVVARYATGTCAWHGGGSYAVDGVLDCAVDAQALLQLARARASAANVTFVDGTQVVRERGHDGGVTLWLQPSAASPHEDASAMEARTLQVRAMVDARGASSPYNRADLICPTVGGVLEGLDTGQARHQIDAQVGEILATTEGIEEGRQHIWEAFPTRPGQTAVYLFYYSRRQDLPPAPMANLYQRFCATLPRFKTGRWRLVRPTFGLIPGWSRMSPASRSPHRRIVLVGDAASRHSPLTFCGFGATLRSLAPSVAAVEAICGERDAASALLAVDDRSLHQITGALAMMLAKPPAEGDKERLNRLLDHAFATLASMGNATFAGLLQDTLPMPQALRFLWRTSRAYPQVWRDVQQILGLRAGTAWALRTAWGAVRNPESKALGARTGLSSSWRA